MSSPTKPEKIELEQLVSKLDISAVNRNNDMEKDAEVVLSELTYLYVTKVSNPKNLEENLSSDMEKDVEALLLHMVSKLDNSELNKNSDMEKDAEEVIPELVTKVSNLEHLEENINSDMEKDSKGVLPELVSKVTNLEISTEDKCSDMEQFDGVELPLLLSSPDISIEGLNSDMADDEECDIPELLSSPDISIEGLNSDMDDDDECDIPELLSSPDISIEGLNSDMADDNECDIPELISSPETSSYNDSPEYSERETDFSSDLEKDLCNESCNDNIVFEFNLDDPLIKSTAVKSFVELKLNPRLLRGINAMGYTKPTKIQALTLPAVLSDPLCNMIAQCQSGTGKTLAYVLPMLNRVDTQKDYPQVLCLLPTFEVAMQTVQIAQQVAKFCPNIKIRKAVRGSELMPSTRLTDHIIIGTPNKVVEWSIKKEFFDLKRIVLFASDEADLMIDSDGHRCQFIRIYRQLDKFQMLLFSSTYDPELMYFAQRLVEKPTVISVKRDQLLQSHIKQFYVLCNSPDEQYNAVLNICGSINSGQVIVFCNAAATAKVLVDRMFSEGYSVALLTGLLTISERKAIFRNFCFGRKKVLITTNMLARGIEVKDVKIIINFEMPMDLFGTADCLTYLHRIGRTGRCGQNGVAISLIGDEKSMSIFRKIESYFNITIAPLNIDEDDEMREIANYVSK